MMAALGGPCANYLFEIRDAESDVTAPPFMSGLMEEIYRSMLRRAIDKHLNADRPIQTIGWRRMEKLKRA